MRKLHIPAAVRAALDHGAALAISISGGKDSQALGEAVLAARREHGWSGPVLAVHAHLGRAEWPQTKAHCHYLAARWGVPLELVSAGDLVDRMRARMDKLAGTGKPFWPSSAARYCTSDMKRGPIDKLLRRYPLVVSAEGIRAAESAARAKKPAALLRKQITAKAYQDLPLDAFPDLGALAGRIALTWNAIHDWSTEEVWRACGHSVAELEARQELWRRGRTETALRGWNGHPAYVMGNERLSCALCILASRNDLCNGARHNPELFAEYVAMERESGFSFRQDLALADLAVA